MTILVTGAAGFIGAALVERLLTLGHTIIGVDNLNPYYDVSLKKARLARLAHFPGFTFELLDIADQLAITQLFATHRFTQVINLAAQAGVRYAVENPNAYVQSNIVGFVNLLEASRAHDIQHFLFASSSSVYGANGKQPYSESDTVDHPVSLYAATKKADEVIAHAYASLYQLPVTGLRFFSVYGPWGRPDMALFKFTRAILNDETIDVYNQGDMYRDFTYIDDIIDAVVALIPIVPTKNPNWESSNPDPGSSEAPYRIYNIGHGQPIKLANFIDMLEMTLNKKAKKRFLPMQMGEVYKTHALTDRLFAQTKQRPKIDLKTGIEQFVKWYREYYQC